LMINHDFKVSPCSRTEAADSLRLVGAEGLEPPTYAL
jgi:hypothetical protein